MLDPAENIHQNFLARVSAGDLPARASNLSPGDVGLTPAKLVELFHTQIVSRHLDRISRKLQAQGQSFYTIGSAGHEGNAAVAEAARVTDMAFLHYRDAAFQIQRAKKVPGQTPIWDMLLSFTASAEDPISGGRHKVLGSKTLWIPPQTSTIASHLPKAMGAAFSIGLAKALKLPDRVLADDAVVLCSFGDASANHSTAQGAINCASWAAYQGSPMPIVFICEDNGIGISTRTPQGWIEASFRDRPMLHYVRGNGIDLLDASRAAQEAIDYARSRKKPVFLHLTCVRLYGHAGADVQLAYLSKTEIERTEAMDPLLHTASLLVDQNIMTTSDVLDLYADVETTIERVATEAVKRPKLTTASVVMESIVPPRRPPLSTRTPSAEERQAVFGSDFGQLDKPQHMARLLSWALTDLMLEQPQIILAGEDIGPKGGVYHVTAKLHSRFGPARVINTLLDEQSILGLGIGAAHNNFLPITEIQFLAYVHNAEDQLRGEAATLSFFSNGQYTNPMIVRIAGLGYQKGFGGHFHNDNSLGVFRDIPGLVLACPSNGYDAVRMLRECVRLASEEQRVIVFLEPIALYMTRDLHADKDGLWAFSYEDARANPMTFGEIGVHGAGEDLAIVTYGNGYYLSRQAEKILAEEHGIRTRVIDLRWLAPVNEQAVLDACQPCRQVLIVDECRITGSQSEALMALFTENMPGKPVRRLAADDSFIPLGTAATLTLPSREDIVAEALNMLARRPRKKQGRAS